MIGRASHKPRCMTSKAVLRMLQGTHWCTTPTPQSSTPAHKHHSQTPLSLYLREGWFFNADRESSKHPTAQSPRTLTRCYRWLQTSKKSQDMWLLALSLVLSTGENKLFSGVSVHTASNRDRCVRDTKLGSKESARAKSREGVVVCTLNFGKFGRFDRHTP